jgi:hypothetical protein
MTTREGGIQPRVVKSGAGLPPYATVQGVLQRIAKHRSRLQRYKNLGVGFRNALTVKEARGATLGSKFSHGKHVHYISLKDLMVQRRPFTLRSQTLEGMDVISSVVSFNSQQTVHYH